MLNRLQLILSAIALPIAIYGMVRKDYSLQPYTILLLGLIMLIMGLVQFQNGRKGSGWLCVCVSMFILYTSFENFLWM
ncbi:DUF3953 domain-containing protein [Priestia flexa]|uniref:DUF3953 domain-containing protein n=1 Tax=Priestia flexa TaxID=86664 RepID=UPI0032EAFB20